MDIIYTKDKYDKDILQDPKGNHQIMMEWEKEYMNECINKLSPFGSVLEVGFGMGYSATKIIETEAVIEYSIIECSSEVWKKIDEFKLKYPNKKINLIKGRWEDMLSNISNTFDCIFFDDYPLDNQPNDRFYSFLLQVIKNNTNINSKIGVYSTKKMYNKFNCLNFEVFDYKVNIPDNCKYAKGDKMYIPIFTKIKEYSDSTTTIINTRKRMRFHCLGIPHTIANDDYIICPYTQKSIKFCKMMKKLGHYIIYYGHEDSIIECDEFVNVISRDEFNKVYESSNYKSTFFKYDVNDIAYQEFNKNTIQEISNRKYKNDFILPFWGSGVKLICNSHPDLICIEPGIGYSAGYFAKYKIFESYSIYNAYLGLQSIDTCKQDWNQVVIPSYFDPNDFEYSINKEDYFLFIGRIHKSKGIEIAIKITELAGAKLIVCGQGTLKDCGYEIIPEHVTEMGYIDKNQRKKLMSKAKGGILPSVYNEPFNGVLIEMLMSGTPVITTDWGSFTENNINGVTGYRCRTLEDFLLAITNINQIKPENCREFAMNFSVDNISKRYEKYFQDILNIYIGDGWFHINSENK